MQLDFLADNAITRRNATLIYTQFFPEFMRSLWIVRGLWLVMIGMLVFFLDFLFAANSYDWIAGWGLPEWFVDWRWSPVAVVAVALAFTFALKLAMDFAKRHSDRLLAAAIPAEQARVELLENVVCLTSESANVTVPYDKITGIAQNKEALVIGFSGAGMVLPRSAFASLTDETAFLRSLARMITPQALQRSSETVRSLI